VDYLRQKPNRVTTPCNDDDDDDDDDVKKRAKKTEKLKRGEHEVNNKTTTKVSYF
jgi:hypothetical protein